MDIKEKLFGNFDIKSIEFNPDFKEDSVREVIILPILKELGYNNESIVRSKSLLHPFIKIGSKKRPITLVPDYVLKVENNYAWVLDAKAPNQKIINNDNVEQVYSYATHPEIRSNYFCLCNGLEFSIYRTSDTDTPVLFFQIDEINNHWFDLSKLLSINSFHFGKDFNYDFIKNVPSEQTKIEYKNRQLLKEIQVKKQAAKRHFGCNAYFTRQSWDIVNAYIKNFTNKGDLVLDSFGGSGVTAIEALMLNRKAIHVDINPLSKFLLNSMAVPIDIKLLQQQLVLIKNEFEKLKPKNLKELRKCLIKYPSPKGNKLPKGSDVNTIEELFTDNQIAELAILKSLIKKISDINIKNSMLLAFYNTISIINKTFHDTPKGGGNHFGYYYRYRIAPNSSYRSTIETFENKVKRIIDGKKEINSKITLEMFNALVNKKSSATNLYWIENESVDYIYTDPPYGKKIAYLDLSTIWNAWLDLEVTEEDYKLEAIEGGELNKSKSEYNELISKSIQEMYRVLKFDRWMSFVFAHKDPEFWHLIIDTAERCGFEYAGAVPQKNGQTSFKKRQNPFTVLSGQLIINFKKVKNPRTIMKANLGMDIAEIVFQTIEGIIAKNHGASLEQINDELIIKGLELGFLDLLKKEYSDLTPILLDNFDYNEATELFSIKKNTKFKTHIDVKLRIRYYLISYLRRTERDNLIPHFDEIILAILPLLKNGITPENQTILSVLEDIADRTGEDGWKLKQSGQLQLFNTYQ